MQTFENIIIDQQNGIYKITINRPEVYNALSKGLLTDLQLAFDEAKTDPTIRVVLLTATGDKAFCAGADLKEGFKTGVITKMSENLTQNYNPLIKKIREIPKPVICALNGIGAGAGSSIALACDIIIASETASLSQIFIKIGLVPDAGASYFLPRIVGSRKAFELFTSGRAVQAEECFSLGLINEVVKLEKLEERAMEIATSYAMAPTKAIGLIKNMINKSYQTDLDQMMALEAEYQDVASLTHDAGEGIFAFLQKRKAEFKGK